MRILLLAAFATVATPVLAAQPTHQFVQDGQTYTYTAGRAANGVVLIDGTTDDGERFALRVNGRAVSGRMGLNEVSFSVPAATAQRLALEVPANEAVASLGR